MKKLILVILTLIIVALSTALGLSISRNLRTSKEPTDEIYIYTFNFSDIDPNGEYLQYVDCAELKTSKDVVLPASFDNNKIELKQTKFLLENGDTVIGYTDSGNNDYSFAFISIQNDDSEYCVVSSNSMGILQIRTSLKIEKLEKPIQDVTDQPIKRYTVYGTGATGVTEYSSTGFAKLDNVYLPTDKPVYVDIYCAIDGTNYGEPERFELRFKDELFSMKINNTTNLNGYKWQCVNSSNYPSYPYIVRAFDKTTGKHFDTRIYFISHYCRSVKVDIFY